MEFEAFDIHPHLRSSMVTGVETAGLVLAAFPIIVKGLTSYIDGLQKIDQWRMYRRELEGYSRRIKTQKTIYINTLELLFEGLLQSDEERAQLINDPKGYLWRNKGYFEQVAHRLDHAYENFLDVLSNMMQTLENFQKMVCRGEG